MALNKEQIDKYIAVLEDFEQKYGEFLVARHDSVMGPRKPLVPSGVGAA